MLNYDWYNERAKEISERTDYPDLFNLNFYPGMEQNFDYDVVYENYDIITPDSPHYATIIMREACHNYGGDAIINFRVNEFYEGDDLVRLCSGTFVKKKDMQESIDYGDYPNTEVSKVLNQITIWTTDKVPFEYEVIDSQLWACTEKLYQWAALRQVEFDLKEMFYGSEVTDIINVEYHINTIKRYGRVPRFAIVATGIAVKRKSVASKPTDIISEEDEF